jgi:cytochrome oxidase assembly protein ShyY1
VAGTYLPEGELLAYGRPLDGQPGDHVLTALRLAGSGTLVLVDRGWVPFSVDRAAPPAAAPPAGELTLEGIWLAPEQGEAFPEGTTGAVRAIDPAAIGAATGLDLATGGFVLLQDQRPAPGALPIPAGLPALDEGPHLSYAIQWFSFAAIACIGYVLLARRDRRRRDGEEVR